MAEGVRDQRDPQTLGETLLFERNNGNTAKRHKLSAVYDQSYQTMLRVLDYDGSGWMSADPADHHSKTRQDIPDDWGDTG